MIKTIGFIFISIAILLALLASSPLKFYYKPGYQRLERLWAKDVKNLYKNKEFSQVLNNIKTVEFNFDDPQVATELEKLGSPFKKNKDGHIILKVQIIRWIAENRYGYVLQHELFDENEDKVFEFGRTYKVGFFW